MNRIRPGLILLTGALLLAALIIPAPAQARIDTSACADVTPGQPISEACLNIMEDFPRPRVLPIQQDGLTLSTYSFWRVEDTQPPVFDAPGGTVVRNMNPGFNFVRVISTDVEGWVQIETGEWIQRQYVEYNDPSLFTGVRILDGLDNQFAWALGTLYTSTAPGERQDTENGRLVYRYDLLNIFAEAYDADGWRWYLIGPDQWIEQRMVAKAFRIEQPEGVDGRWVAIDLYEQTLIAYEDDTPVFATLIATGVPGWDTNEGVFEVWARLDRDRMSGATGAPDGWDLQSVPWVLYFDGSISLHGTYWHDNFGYRQSRGCVNLSISDAAYVYDWLNDTDQATEDGDPLNYVYVHSSGEYRTDGAATK
ncbi:MAG: L,D-transpeptidase [Chloroflexota bacterium]